MAKAAANKNIDRVVIRMYCIGTGDCFVLKFLSGDSEKFTMMIDCGCCTGDAAQFKPYVEDLAAYVKKEVDLLVVTHEHQDHVNGFAKCKDIFETIKFKEAWFAWTENPEDPDGTAAELLKKRNEMRLAFSNSMTQLKTRFSEVNKYNDSYYKNTIIENNNSMLGGLGTLADINLPAADEGGGQSLAGMVWIKDKLKRDEVKPQYLKPGEVKTHKKAPGIKFYVLGPPFERSFIFKDGKTGKDVFNKNALFINNSFSEAALSNSNGNINQTDIPFNEEYIIKPDDLTLPSDVNVDPELKAEYKVYENIKAAYEKEGDEWRKIDDDWLNSTGSLALRLNSHINNTSLALAIEFQDSDKKVILLPGDAEYGSWDSWHAIEKWKPTGDNKKHFVEELLNRTVFYKVSHHMSYNGTPTEQGIKMMNSEDLVAFATLDRNRIAAKWKSTMPNKLLLEELITRCQGKMIIMNELDINNKPSNVLAPKSLGKEIYQEQEIPGSADFLYKQYTVSA